MSWVPEKLDVNGASQTAGKIQIYDKAQASCQLTDSTTASVLATAVMYGSDPNDFTIAMVNDVSAAAEAAVWTAPTYNAQGQIATVGAVVIHKAATSTAAQIVTMAGGNTGTALFTFTAVGAGAVAGTLAATKVRNMPVFSGGYLNSQRK